MIAFYLIGIAIGLFMIAVAVFNWEWWYFDRESRFWEAIGGETAVRCCWGIGGAMVIIATVVHWIWGIDLW